MLDRLIRLSLRQRALVLLLALLTLAAGMQAARDLPLEVLPDLTKPTVTILTEAPGLAPEEVEARVTLPLEAAVQGAGGLDRLRSSSDVGLSLVFAEFAWGTDIYRARQLVQERLQAAAAALPAGVAPGLTPVSSLMGEILLVGLRSTNDAAAPVALRTLADWTVRRRLQAIPGVAEVLAIGGGVRQLHVQPDPRRMAALGVTLAEVSQAAGNAAGNAASGYLEDGPRELMVRQLAMTTDPGELGRTVVKWLGDRPVFLHEVADIVPETAPRRGDAGVNGRPGVILSVDKAPGFDTLAVTAAVEQALEELRPSLPAGVEAVVLFRQADFIQHALGSLREAIRDGALMVAAVLLLFLLNFRTTAITLTAIPLSFAVTLLVFRALDVSVNAMTLGGLAVALGLVVDDAIVDVENVYRRLRQHAAAAGRGAGAPAGESPTGAPACRDDGDAAPARSPVAGAGPAPALEVVAAASAEVRHSILHATLLVILVFLPLLGLLGLEGRLFTPIAIATIVSLAASFVVSLTVIPVLCSLLLRPRPGAAPRDTPVVRALKRAVEATFLRAALRAPLPVLALVGTAFLASLLLYPRLGRNFLPPFNEGSATVTLASPPGTSLNEAAAVGAVAERLLLAVPEVRSVGRRTGRAERDDHVMPVSVNEFDLEFHAAGRPRAEVFADIRARLGAIPGTFVVVGQPLGHRLDHMLSGVTAKIAVKVFGPDLEVLRQVGAKIEGLAREAPGLTDVFLERQAPIPQLRIVPDRDRLPAHGLTPGALNEQVAALVGGRTVAELREGPRTVDLVVRLAPAWRDSPERLEALPVELPDGRRVPLRLLADLHRVNGPNVVHRENSQRRIVVAANPARPDLEALVREWEDRVRATVTLPEGYFLRFEGEHAAQRAASRRIGLLFAGVLGLVIVLLRAYFGSLTLASMVLLNLPLALMGGLALTWLLVGNLSIATLVGFIAVGGIAARNGILMLSHYLHLMRHEGEGFTPAMIVRGTLERLVPVLMTALSAGLALVPLLLAAGEPGREILHPVAVVIVGGLASSTLLDLVVTPAVFWAFGRRAAQAALARGPRRGEA